MSIIDGKEHDLPDEPVPVEDMALMNTMWIDQMFAEMYGGVE